MEGTAKVENYLNLFEKRGYKHEVKNVCSGTETELKDPAN